MVSFRKRGDISRCHRRSRVGATAVAVLQALGVHSLAGEGSAFQGSSDSLVLGLE